MKFKKTKFFAAFEDGLLLMEGYAFDIGNRLLVVHRRRPELADLFKDYTISERTTGFGIPIPQAKTRSAAVAFAVDAMAVTSDEKWRAALAAAVRRYRQLKPIER